MGFGKSFRRALRKVGKVAAVAAATYFTGGAALTLLAQQQQAKAAAKAQAQQQAAAEQQYLAGLNFNPQSYSAPYNPGYGYTGSADSFGGAASMMGGGGAAIPISQVGGDSGGGGGGFQVTPMIALAALGILGVGFVLLRR